MADILSNLTPAKGSRKKVKRIGRGQGSGHGGTATRGHKGQGSRSGARTKRGFEGGQMPLSRRIPKFGFKAPFRVEYTVINVDALEKALTDGKLKAGEAITPETLFKAGMIAKKSAPVKILGNGALTQKLAITAHKFSKSAVEKITAAGGSATEAAAVSAQ
ncbi:MAG: 50S ribosomal protein L15 [Acidobacteriota bacterium]